MNASNMPGDWGAAKMKRWTEVASESLEKHRELLDASYRSGIHLIEQAMRVTDAKSPEDFRRLTEELTRKVQETLHEQSEMQFREMQRAATRWAELTQMTS
jgi:hypothetical protein